MTKIVLWFKWLIISIFRSRKTYYAFKKKLYVIIIPKSFPLASFNPLSDGCCGKGFGLASGWNIFLNVILGMQIQLALVSNSHNALCWSKKCQFLVLSVLYWSYLCFEVQYLMLQNIIIILKMLVTADLTKEFVWSALIFAKENLSCYKILRCHFWLMQQVLVGSLVVEKVFSC